MLSELHLEGRKIYPLGDYVFHDATQTFYNLNRCVIRFKKYNKSLLTNSITVL